MAKKKTTRKRNKPASNHRGENTANVRKPTSPVAPKKPAAQKAAKIDSLPLELSTRTWGLLLVCITILFLWSYWPTLTQLVSQWNNVPDYSHGFLVVPIAAYILWLTRDEFTRSSHAISWMGVSLILLAFGLRIAGAYLYLEALHGWSIPIWIMGVIWMFFGWRAFTWSLPAVAFLIFMVPLPYTIENMLSQPLQRVSTQISLFILQSLGQPALAEGTTITLGPNTLEIERACSGLRIFFGITALASAFIMLFKRPFWTKLMLFAAILPITLLANSLRIVATGMLYQIGLDETAKHLGHDLAGWFMIPLAAALFALTLLFLDKLFPMVSNWDPRSMVQSQTRRQPTRSA